MIIDLRGRTRIDIFPLATYLSEKPIPFHRLDEPIVGFLYGRVTKGITLYPIDSLKPSTIHQYNKPVIVLIDANM